MSLTVEVKAGAVKFAKDENLASVTQIVAFNTTVSTTGIVTPVVEKLLTLFQSKVM